jgi:hypothetical protein
MPATADRSRGMVAEAAPYPGFGSNTAAPGSERTPAMAISAAPGRAR